MSDDVGEGTRPGRKTENAEASSLISEHFTSLKNNLASFKEEIKRGKRRQWNE